MNRPAQRRFVRSRLKRIRDSRLHQEAMRLFCKLRDEREARAAEISQSLMLGLMLWRNRPWWRKLLGI